MNYKYHLKNLGCPNCAAKIAERIQKIPSVEKTSISFPTSSLMITGHVDEATYSEISKIIDEIEPGCFIDNSFDHESLMPSSSFIKDFFSFLKEDISFLNRTLMVVAILLFIVSIFIESKYKAWHIILALVSYFILAKDVILKSIKNIIRGDFFDENFLMSIATIGAIFIKQYEEAVGVMLFYQIGELFQEFASHRSLSKIKASIDLRVDKATQLLDDNTTRIIDPKLLQPKDKIIINAGEVFPVDGIVLKGQSQVDTSAITGESLPRVIQEGSFIYGGYLNLSGSIILDVEKNVSESMSSRILESVEQAANNKPKMERFITRFSRIYTPIVCLIALLTATIPSIITGNFSYWIYTALTFLVISCPCALVLSVPLSFFAGLGLASKYGILFKGASVLEELAHIQSVALDKTGTLTEGNFKVQEVILLNSLSKNEILNLAINIESLSNHPIAKAISVMDFKDFQKIDFENIIEKSGLGMIAKTNGNQYLLGNEKLMAMFGVKIESVEKSKVLGTKLYFSKNNCLEAIIILSDTIKEDAKVTINELNKLGISTAMLTGDLKDTAEQVSNYLGISQTYSQLLPEEKLKTVQQLREASGSVLFVGDGINDTPVMAGANVGAAFGDGADAAIEVCDLVYLQPSTLNIPKSIQIAKQTLRTSYICVGMALLVKIMVMILGLLGYSNMWMAVFADSGISLICVLYASSLLRRK